MTSELKVDAISNAAGTSALTIDSNGNMTTDQYVQQKGLPYFCVGKSNGATTAGNVIIFNTVFNDNNGDYSTSTGKFTAPVDGTYFFSFMLLSSSTANQQDNVIVYKDNTNNDVLRLRSDGDHAGHNTMSGSFVIKLTAGQTIFVKCSDGEIYGNNNKWTQMSGYQIA